MASSAVSCSGACSAGACFPAAFFAWLLLYLASTLAYSLYFKRIALVDVLVLSGLYILRLLAGGAATADAHLPLAGRLFDVPVSLAGHRQALCRAGEPARQRHPPRNGRGYLLADIEQLRSFGTASAYAAVVVFAIYISGSDVMKLYRQPRTALADRAA